MSQKLADRNCRAREFETPGVVGRNYVDENSMSEYLAAGGRVMK